MDCCLGDLEPNLDFEGKSLEEIFRRIQSYFSFPLSDQKFSMVNPLMCLVVSLLDYLLEFKIRLENYDNISRYSAFSVV